jgi:preprotein translocase subunit SecF
VPADKADDFRRVAEDTIGQQWILSSETASDFRINLRPEAAYQLRQDRLAQSMKTIQKKVDALGEFIIGTAIADEQSLEQTRLTVEQMLREKCANNNLDIRSVEIVGPRASEQLRRQGLYATLGALGGMLVYVAFRFRLVSGMAAVIATVHDVVITLGLFSLTNREIDSVSLSERIRRYSCQRLACDVAGTADRPRAAQGMTIHEGARVRSGWFIEMSGMPVVPWIGVSN